MVKGDVIFCATGVTSGDLAKGVIDLGNEFEVNTFGIKVKKLSSLLQTFTINDCAILKWKKMDFKRFNEHDIRYIKENFSLDEITSKLLSIRKIKKRI